jgi:hypothetical protein
MSVYFMSGGNVGQVRQITASTGTTLTFTPALIANLYSGDQYYIGKSSGDSRHVSCADCHNTHASTNNPEGEITGADAGDAQNSTTTVVSSRAYTDFWSSGEWNGHLLKMVLQDKSTGTKHEEIRFVSGFVLDTPNERGEITVSIPFTRAVEAPACVGASGADRQECEGNGGNWYEDRFEICMGDKWVAAGFCTDPAYSTKATCEARGAKCVGASGGDRATCEGNGGVWERAAEWRYQDGGRAGSGSTGVWGVCAVAGPASTWPDPAGADMTQAELGNLDWAKIENIFDKKSPYQEGGSPWAVQADLCIRCHSYFSFKEAYPVTPSGHADASAALETDVVSDFNPKNEAHHAVYTRGQNQPIVDVGDDAARGIQPAVSAAWAGNYTREVRDTGGGDKGTYVCTDTDASSLGSDGTIVNIAILEQGFSSAAELDCSPSKCTQGGELCEFIIDDAGSPGTPGQSGNTIQVAPAVTAGSEFNANWPVWAPGNNVQSISGNQVVFKTDMPATVLPGWFYVDKDENSPDWTFREVVSVDGPRTITLKSTPAGGANTDGGLTAGLGNTFVPPFGPWSVLRCTDCHGSTKTDPVGPHASVNRWLMKTRDDALKFEWFIGTKTDGSPVIATVDPGNQHTINDQYLCFNCHRRDVYGDIEETKTGNGGTDPGDPTLPGNAALSRQRHAQFMDTNANTWQLDSNSTLWDQHCRMCHGGDKLGAIHGSNSSYALRFLNGASWGGSQSTYTAPGNLSTTPPSSGAGTCYAANANGAGTPGEKVSTCSSHSGGSTMIEGAQYDYQGKYNP